MAKHDNEKFNTMTTDVQAQVKEVLGTYKQCYAIRDNGEWIVRTAVGVTADYSADHAVYTFTNELVTDIERIKAELANSWEFPRGYQGERDWDKMNKAEANKTKIYLGEDGNIVYTDELREDWAEAVERFGTGILG